MMESCITSALLSAASCETRQTRSKGRLKKPYTKPFQYMILVIHIVKIGLAIQIKKIYIWSNCRWLCPQTHVLWSYDSVA